MTTEKTPKADAFVFNKDGSISVVAGGESYHMPPADMKRLRAAKGLVYAATSDMAASLGLTVGELQAGKADNIDPGVLMKAEQAFEEASVPIMREIFSGAGCPLPEDDDDWPAWITSSELPQKILDHWKTTPLDRGR